MSTKTKNKTTSVRLNEHDFDLMAEQNLSVQDVITAYLDLMELVGPTKALKVIKDKVITIKFEALDE